MVSKNDVVERIEQIDAILTVLHDLRRAAIRDLETIEANSQLKVGNSGQNHL